MKIIDQNVQKQAQEIYGRLLGIEEKLRIHDDALYELREEAIKEGKTSQRIDPYRDTLQTFHGCFENVAQQLLKDHENFLTRIDQADHLIR